MEFGEQIRPPLSLLLHIIGSSLFPFNIAHYSCVPCLFFSLRCVPSAQPFFSLVGKPPVFRFLMRAGSRGRSCARVVTKGGDGRWWCHEAGERNLRNVRSMQLSDTEGKPGAHEA